MADYDFEQFKKDFLDGVGNAADAVSSAAKETSGSVIRFKDFNEIGRDLFLTGAVTSHGGNLSVSNGTYIWITRTGSMLGHLLPGDIVQVGWDPGPADEAASMELVVHRAMYHALAQKADETGAVFGARAIVHAHSKHTVLRSLISNAIEPLDSEGKLILGESIPVFSAENTVASPEVAQLLAAMARAGSSIAVVRGHGPFALADTLEHAYRLVSCLEYSAELLTLLDSTGRTTV
jgi:L-fuculose-phosphate aldolase